MGNDIFYNHLTGFADLKLDITSTPHKLLGRLAGGDYFVIGADGKDGANQYLYIAYADDEFGTNFSTTKPSSYISFYQSTTPVNDLTASMFTEWKKYVGKDGTSGKSVYVGYAQSQSGSGFSFVAGRERPFVAFITSDKPQEEITAADFAGANFVRFHDSGWNNMSLDDLTDVDTANESGGTVLMYDESDSAWRAVRLADVCYSGSYDDLTDAPTPYTFNSTMFQEDSVTHEISIASDYVQASLGINSDPQDSASNYFLNQNGDWVEIHNEGGSGGSIIYEFSYPLSESGNSVVLRMDELDTDAASVGWVRSQGYISSIPSEMIYFILGIDVESGSSSRVLAENGTWVDLPQNSGGGESPTYTFQHPLQESGGNVTLDTSGFLLTGALTGYALKTDIPTKVSELENDSQYITVSALSGYALKTDIPTVPTKVSELENDEGYLTEVTKESVDTALGISANGSAEKYLNEQGQFVELETGSTGATAGGRNLFDIFYSMSSKTPPGAMDLSLGTLISSADTALPDFYNECVSRASAGTIPTCTETVWQSEVSTYGSCAKFVVNTTDKSIRLPKITNYLRAGSDSELGTVLNDQFQGHRHYGQSSTIISGSGSDTGGTGLKRVFCAETDGTIEGDSGVPRVGSETRPKTSCAKLYIQVYNSATEVSMAQAAEFINSLEAIYTKIAGQFSETTTSAGTTGTGANDTVVEYWKSADGTMWYRLWASGWVEQGGFIDRTVSANTTVTVSLPVEFSDGNYTILRSFGSTGTGTAVYRSISTTARTTTTFNIYVGSASDSANSTWYACGWST